MGPNGAGKSTLLKLLTHHLTPTEGTVVDHPGFTLAYFGQQSTKELDPELTPSEFMAKMFPTANSGALRGHLGKTGILGFVQDTRMKSLSYSQRSCVIFSKLTFICPHLLIMDEPTNFLDLESVDSLINACNKYKGALLLVSHNRDFLQRCVSQYLSITPGNFNFYSDLKAAMKATYPMEEGEKFGASALSRNVGAEKKKTETKDGKTEEKVVKSVSISSTPSSSIKAVAPAAPVETYAVNEKCMAYWEKDKKYYSAIVKKIVGTTYVVAYTQYGNSVTLSATQMKKIAIGKKK